MRIEEVEAERMRSERETTKTSIPTSSNFTAPGQWPIPPP
jgi:hypothetical protein